MKNSVWTPLFAAVVGGIITAGSNIYVNSRQESQKLLLQKQQFESELILRAIVPDSITRSKKNIDILVKAGFISKENEIIKKLDGNDSLLNIHLRMDNQKGGDHPTTVPPNP